MSKYSKPKGKSTKTKSGYKSPKEHYFCDYNPATVNPNTTQFEPTDADLLPRRAKQAGMQ